MSATPWTPGPWVVTWSADAGGVYVDAPFDPLTVRGSSRRAIANRALIAAAPEMAEALTDLVEVVDYIERTYGSRINPPTLDNARALLARIRGDAT